MGDALQTNTHAVAIEQNAVQQGFEELERYLRSQGPALATGNEDVTGNSASPASDDPRRVGFDALARSIERQREFASHS
jgi:hypothetical protein